MSNAAKSILVFGIYLLVLSVVLLTVPNVPLSIFGLGTTNEVWIRVVGMMSLVLGGYYVRAAQHEMTEFFRWSVSGRIFAIICFTVFVVLGFAPINLLLLVAADPIFIVWTVIGLRSAGSATAPAAQPVR